MHKVWIEAALNGPWGRERQPSIPVTVEEIIADGLDAAGAGAAIIHIHAYDPTTGRQNDQWETHARIIEGIRAKADVIVYPTIPLAGSDYASTNTQRRFAHTAELAKREMLEWTVCDPGSCNFSRFDEIDDLSAGFVYQNPIADIREGLRLSREHHMHPGYAIYEPGFTRLGAALARAVPGLPTPIYRFMFSDEFAWGFPPRRSSRRSSTAARRRGAGCTLDGCRSRRRYSAADRACCVAQRSCACRPRGCAVANAADEQAMGGTGGRWDPQSRRRACFGSGCARSARRHLRVSPQRSPRTSR
jgi:hypothetical protein